jgi:hypothetical protein
VTAAAFAAVLDCIYTGKMVVEEESIVAVVHISNKLELLAVRSACIWHLVSRIKDSNMEQMLALGQELACTELVDAAKAAICKRSGYGSPNGDDKEEEELACTELVDAAKAAIRKRSGYGSPNGDDMEEDDQVVQLVVRFLSFLLSLTFLVERRTAVLNIFPILQGRCKSSSKCTAYFKLPLCTGMLVCIIIFA